MVLALCSRVSHKDQCLLEDITDVKQELEILREQHEKVGLIAQILLIQEVFTKRYLHGHCFSLTSSELIDLIQHIYRIGISTEEVFLSIAILNAMFGELNAVQTQVTFLLSSSSKSHPFTSADICAHLDIKQQLLDNEQAHSSNIALVATATRPKPSSGHENTYSLCGKSSHTINGCWQPGGDMAGHCEEVLAKIHSDKLTHQGKAGGQSSLDPALPLRPQFLPQSTMIILVTPTLLTPSPEELFF
ncbi:hypothetical protein BDN67DRAFT_1015785 [Paxillus ammoniavirescens]|nr:hypothetical protein BDN67DRAFT_1015785 [Paxillus ammoniavirescens]